ncbi:hypothetical protein VE01_01993 [Pseudogymnoascus verrucosus]|uniref:Uncharacterized protein n=1 Tax=Pseudogymnoascus verrucosus TaxID=342668 RepID=A0A1B8GVK2_9PEZI|nr:uncharacterized protein VE01_01993 [Pseudogymnoascus verrucosus]OBT99864.2 hypothetical protein VE01_01993 [Pseudogymnoascus verrucosus]
MIGVPVRRSSMATQQADRLGAISHGMGGGGLPGFERVDEVPAQRSMADSSFTAQSTLKRNAAGSTYCGGILADDMGFGINQRIESRLTSVTGLDR